MSDTPSPQKVTYLGQVDYRNKQLTFGIKENDRTRHMYIIGKTGMGKSTLLENMAVQDIRNGEGLCVIDPHGSFAEKLLDYIPPERKEDVIYFAPFDTEHPLGLNVLEKVDISKRHLVANGLMSAFKKIFGEERFSDRIQYILNNIILALLENENESLLGVNRMLIDKEYRKFIVSNVKDPSVKSFWEEEFVKAGDKYQQEAAPGIQNKIGQFISNPLIRNIIGQKRTSFDVREIMDKKKILIVNLSKGKVGEGNANLIGSLLITKIYLAAMSRADAGVHELEKLPPFYFYVDEFQNFANESFANILSEARKYNLALTVAHQYVEQMTDEVKAAVFGNVGSMIVFRVGATDAEIFEKEFAPYFVLDDIVNLSAFQIYLRLMIDGVGSRPFSAKTLVAIKRPEVSHAEDIIAYTREKYAKKVGDAEDEIREWYAPKIAPPKEVKETKENKPAGEKAQENQSSQPAPRRDERNRNGNGNGNSGRDERKSSPHQRDGGEGRNANKTFYTDSESKKTVTENVVPIVAGTGLGAAILQAREEIKTEVVAKKEAATVTPASNAVSEPVRERERGRAESGEKMTSLKEALQKALEEREAASSQEKAEQDSRASQNASVDDAEHAKKETGKNQDTESGNRKEVPEDTLRPLIYDENDAILIKNETV